VKHELAKLRVLAVRAGDGDRAAALEFLRQIEPFVRRFVRRVIRTRTAKSPIAERILQEASRIFADPEAVVALVTQIVCHAIVEQLSNPNGWQALQDTLAD
jgi:hypothetical protein